MNPEYMCCLILKRNWAGKQRKHMKLKEGFIAREIAGENMMVSITGAFSGFVRSNETAAFIVDCLTEETTEQEIIRRMLEKYDAPQEIISEDVKMVLDTLRGIGALDE